MIQIYRANIVYAPACGEIAALEHHYIAVEKGKVLGIYQDLPCIYENLPVINFGNQILIPGFNDIHLHAGQFPINGIGYDGQLFDWIENYASEAEHNMSQLDYANISYQKLIQSLWKYGITRSVILGTHQRETNELLFHLLEESGLGAWTGKSVCDRSSSGAADETTDTAISDMLYFCDVYSDKSDLVRYVLSATYVPGCSSVSMQMMAKLAKRYNLPVSSHLDENQDEVALVRSLYPESPDYASVYNEFHLWGDTKTVMAHCIHTTEHEKQLLENPNVWVAHCPHSNLNLSSGIMPLREYLDRNIHVGLGSDISAGHTLNMMSNMTAAIQCSKMYWLNHPDKNPLTAKESFYLATSGGGSLFGNVGSFENGFEFDALLIDDSNLYHSPTLSLWERVEQFIYLGDDRNIMKRFISGTQVLEPVFRD